MYPQARVFIRTALIYLAAAGILGGALLAGDGLGWANALAPVRPLFYHLLTVGWATQLIGGVALWMFPPLSRERPRGDERLGWAAYAGLNAGLLLRVAEPFLAWRPGPWVTPALVASASLQFVAVCCLIAALWPRVKGRR
jgi:hypothetical protein